MNKSQILVVIPARGGSKGVPGKNIKPLGGKPLICHAIDQARRFTSAENICVSTDDQAIITVARDYGQEVPFIRPAALSGDQVSMREVLLHAVEYYGAKGRAYEGVLLLQPTSPFRTSFDIEQVYSIFNDSLDMAVSVAESHYSPYFSLFEEDAEGLLRKSKPGVYFTRQEAPKVYYLNGAVYLINIMSLRKSPIAEFQRIRKYQMDELHSVDIDNIIDWLLCETILEKGYFKYENN